MAIWGRRASSSDADDATAAPPGTAAEARRRRAAAALRRELPKFSRSMDDGSGRIEPGERSDVVAPHSRRFPRRGDPVMPEALPPSAAQEAPWNAGPALDPSPAPAPRRQAPRRPESQDKPPAAAIIGGAVPPPAGMPSRRLTPSQRRAAASSEAGPQRSPGPSHHLVRPGTKAGLVSRPDAKVTASPIIAGPEAMPILDPAALPVEPPASNRSPSRRQRVPDLLGALLAKRKAAVLPEPPAPAALRPRPALRYPRPAALGPGVKPEIAASRAEPDATEAPYHERIPEPPAPAELPAEEPGAPTAAAPARQRSATFLASRPQREAPPRTKRSGDGRETLRRLLPRVFGLLRRTPKPQATAPVPAMARQADQVLPPPGRAAPPVPPGLPAQPLAVHLLRLLRPPRPLPQPAAAVAAPQTAPHQSRFTPPRQQAPQGTDFLSPEANEAMPPPPSAQRPPPPRPPGEPIRGVIPRFLGVLQPKDIVRAGSAPKRRPEFLQEAPRHRQAAAAMSAAVADRLPWADDTPALSLGPWLLQAPASVRPEEEPQADAADDAATAPQGSKP